MSASSDTFDTLKDRGFVQQVTDEAAVRALLKKPPVTVYIGYDPTADSLHVGNLFTLMALVHLERGGHRCIAVAGGGTAMVGDPSGKTELRQMLTKETIGHNLGCITAQIGRLLDVAGGRTRVVDNGDWLHGLNYIDFLRDIGRHFSVNRMLAAEAYKLRLERGLSFIEFNYQILQAFDFLELRRRYDCRLQMGGDDQWGNILAGVDLCRRVDSVEVHGLTFPLQLTATGEKMGKTASGAVWLSGEKLPPYGYYQYWVNTHDADVVRMLGYFTLLPMAEVRAVASLQGSDLNAAKNVLAWEATALVHGRAAADQAHQAALAGFGDRALPAGVLPSSQVPRRAGGDLTALPTLALGSDELAPGIPIVDLLVRAGLAKSKGEARRKIGEGAVHLGGERVTDPTRTVAAVDLGSPEGLLLKLGKKLHRLARA